MYLFLKILIIHNICTILLNPLPSFVTGNIFETYSLDFNGGINLFLKDGADDFLILNENVYLYRYNKSSENVLSV